MEHIDSSDVEAARAMLLALRAALPAFPGLRDWVDSSPIQQARAAAGNGKSVLLLAGDQSVLLSPRGLEQWLREYHVNIPVSLSGNPPTDEEARRGASWVLRVGPPGRVLLSEQELDTSDPIQRLIAAEYIRATRG